MGRVAVVSQSGIKWYQVRPGLNSVLALGFSDAYHLVFDTGYSKHVYRVEIPITTNYSATGSGCTGEEPTQRAKQQMIYCGLKRSRIDLKNLCIDIK